jgi:hypothetical protein
LIGRPLKELGFDPILNMPDFETFAAAVGKRKVVAFLEILTEDADKGVTTRSDFLCWSRELGCVFTPAKSLTLEMKVFRG